MTIPSKSSTGGSDCTDRLEQAGRAAYTKHSQGRKYYRAQAGPSLLKLRTHAQKTHSKTRHWTNTYSSYYALTMKRAKPDRYAGYK